MKILIVSTYDIQGGAARAAYRLHKALLSLGVNSLMLVQIKKSDDPTVIPVYDENNKIQKAIAMIRPKLDQIPVKLYKNRTKTLFSTAWLPFSNAIKKINEIKPDIVNLHWIADGMLKIEDLTHIQAPIVWTLQDMWAFTGGCHYDEGCSGWLKQCGNCKVLGSNKINDLSKIIYRRKKKIFESKKDIIIVGTSRWITECSKSSTLLKGKLHINIPTPVDTSIFKPFDKFKARELWRLPSDKKLILFGAINATDDPRKGFKELTDALHRLKDKNNIELVIFGSSKPKNAPDFGFNTHYLGHLYDDVSLVTLYSAVDVTVVPSLQENLSNIIMESLSCGTPVVAFNIGGNSDMIEHKINGYLAKPYDPEDLAQGIEWVLNHRKYYQLCQNARQKVLREFDIIIVAKKYIDLFEKILKGNLYGK